MRVTTLLFLIASAAAAQVPVAPSPDLAGVRNGENVQNYNIVDSFETGYRYRTVGGSMEQYRSSVNFGDGIRLLGSSLLVTSKNGHGLLFDQITLSTQGLGNDPYESVVMRVEKNRIYSYDMNWRQNDYFNPGLVTAGGGGQHLLDTQHRMQDHNLTLFPQSNLKVFLGFSNSSQTGPGYSSIQQFDATGNIFPLFSNVHRVWREYRLGNEFRVFGIRVNWMHGWQDFKDDTGATIATSGVPGALPPMQTPGVSLNSFQSSDPNHGTNPYWRAAIFTDRKLFHVNGRFTYSGGRHAFVTDESAQGIASSLARVQNVVTLGNAERPAATGNLNLNFTPNSKLTIANSTSVYNIRTLGNSFFSEFDSATQTTSVLFYNYLGIRTVANDTDLNYQVSPLLGLMTGYHYSDRLISSQDQFTFAGTTSKSLAEQSNQLHSGEVGLRLRPWQHLSMLFSAEIGANSHPFTPLADGNYHAFSGRIQYRAKTFRLTAAANANYNANSVSLTSYASQSRTYSVSGNWTLRSRFTIDAGFNRAHTYTIGGIAYFFDQQLLQDQSSIYLSNINSIYAGLRYEIGKRIDLYAGYTRVQDLGDGRPTAAAGIGSAPALFQSVQTFPIAFQSPMARLSVKINERLRWNAGYQYYGYRSDFASLLGYRANTGYTSLAFSF
ncbi:MAG TPA: hypothetical protein VL127_10850 [Bryobacteraceae bacterium]|nr:hypothetical protein [Bryobacteraceae bacterium]